MSIEIGIKGRAEDVVREENTAQAVGSGTLPVFATPAMTALMEKAAWTSLAPYLSEGESTVGTKLEITHDSASPLGIKVWAESEVTQVDGKRIVLKVAAYDEKGLIGQGVHELGLGAAHIRLGQAGLEVGGGDGEEGGVVVRVGLIEPAVDLVDGGGEIVGGRLHRLAAARPGQQVKEHPDGVDQQLLAQKGQHAPLQGVVLLLAQVIQLLRGDGGAVPAEGAAQEKVGGHAVVVAGLHHEGQAGLPDAVLIVAEQGLGNTQLTGGGALADALLPAEQGEGAGKF